MAPAASESETPPQFHSGARTAGSHRGTPCAQSSRWRACLVSHIVCCVFRPVLRSALLGASGLHSLPGVGDLPTAMLRRRMLNQHGLDDDTDEVTELDVEELYK